MNRIPAICGRTLLCASLLVGIHTRAWGQGTQAAIGVQVERDVTGGRITLVAPGSPAERAGLHKGDVILSVNDAPMHSLDVDAMVAKLRGPLGTSAKLVIMAADGSGRTINVVRAMPIPATAATSTLRSDAIAALQTPPPATTTPAAGQPTTGAAGTVAFVTYTEPKEHAFTVEIPRGWQVIGGVNWTSRIDAQQYLRLRSADGKVNIFMGDPDLLPRQVPNAVSRQQTGARDGQTFKTAYGATAVLLPYISGSQYSDQHVRWRQLCQNPRTVWSSDLPDASQELTATLAPKGREFGAIITVSVGEVGFLCDDAQGYVHSATMLASASNRVIQVWGILTVAGFVSTDPMQSMQARFITEHVLATYKSDPAWDKAYEDVNRQVTGSFISMQNAAFAMQQNAARNASNDLARLNHPNAGVNVRPGSSSSSGGRNTTLGTADVCDAIGRCKRVSNDADSWFIDHSGNVRAGRAGGAPPDNSGVWSPAYVRP